MTLERGPSTTKSVDNDNLGYMWSLGEPCDVVKKGLKI